MKLQSGYTYQVLKKDRKVITFKFTGATFEDETPMAEVDGKVESLYEILKDGYLSYWEVRK